MASHLSRGRVATPMHGVDPPRARGGNVVGVEATGPTVDDAIDNALDELDLDEDDVEIEILSEGGDGAPARERATPRAEVVAEEDEEDEEELEELEEEELDLEDEELEAGLPVPGTPGWNE